jgi:hypothetical protein
MEFIQTIKQGDSSNNSSDLYWKVAQFELQPEQTILTKYFRDFLLPLRANTGT